MPDETIGRLTFLRALAWVVAPLALAACGSGDMLSNLESSRAMRLVPEQGEADGRRGRDRDDGEHGYRRHRHRRHAQPPQPLADWVGVIGTGQSLSVGAAAGTPISTVQPFNNLKLHDDGPIPQYPLDGSGVLSLVPLTERFRPSLPGWDDNQYPNNLAGETPNAGMANEITQLWLDRTGTDFVTLHSVVGWSGHCLRDIDKSNPMRRAYPGGLSEARTFKRMADEAGKTFAYAAVILTHGECDASNPLYEDGLHQLWLDYNQDLKDITGQTTDVPLLVSQQSTIQTASGGSAVAVWKLGVDHPGEAFCVGPKYQYQYAGDNLHMEAAGYRRLGEKYAEVFDQVVNQGILWKPVQPTAAVLADNKISLTFDVPSPPLQWDENINPPHQRAHTAWANGRGFEVKDSTGELTISSVEIVGDTTVEITLDQPPAGANLMVRYALTQDGTGIQGGTKLGMHGQLRDSDSLVGYDLETIPCNVTQGSGVITSVAPNAFVGRIGRDDVDSDSLPNGTVVLRKSSNQQMTLSTEWTGSSGAVDLTFHHDQHNYCVQFELPVN